MIMGCFSSVSRFRGWPRPHLGSGMIMLLRNISLQMGTRSNRRERIVDQVMAPRMEGGSSWREDRSLASDWGVEVAVLSWLGKHLVHSMI